MHCLCPIHHIFPISLLLQVVAPLVEPPVGIEPWESVVTVAFEVRSTWHTITVLLKLHMYRGLYLVMVFDLCLNSSHKCLPVLCFKITWRMIHSCVACIDRVSLEACLIISYFINSSFLWVLSYLPRCRTVTPPCTAQPRSTRHCPPRPPPSMAPPLALIRGTCFAPTAPRDKSRGERQSMRPFSTSTLQLTPR
jgi:hypothetical protein